MSRRESRVSMNVRQNDALFEFENFKKKFLLANKHITKLNSTLSVRIEELNAQISTLYVENLRLRASEIALAAQLKREREKSRKIMAETEAATLSLTKHLGYLRQTFNIKTSTPTPPTPPSPKARRPPTNPNPSPSTPQGIRISRAPNVPGIYEEEEPEPCLSSSSEAEQDRQATPPRRKPKPKPRLSASRLPLPSRALSPPPEPEPPIIATLHVDLAAASSIGGGGGGGSNTRKKPTRRQSGLLTVNTSSLSNDHRDALSVPRAPSPAFGSPIRREAGLAEEEDELAAINGEMPVFEVDMVAELEGALRKERRRGKAREREAAEASEREAAAGGASAAGEAARVREQRSRRTREEDTSAAPAAEGTVGSSKPRLKDVTNSPPRSRAALLPINNTVTDGEAAATSPARPFLGTQSNSPPLPTPRASSSPAPDAEADAATAAAGGRERRARKSVNYAEPKLNTKMRKPDPPTGATTSAPRKRASAAAVMATYKPVEDNGNDADNDTEARSSLEMPLRGANGNYINPEMFPLPASRPASAVGGQYSPGPSRAMTPSSTSTGTSSGGHATTNSSSSSGKDGAAATSVKRKKSRPQIVLDEDDDGVEADREFSDVARGASGGSWINTDGRKKGGQTLKRTVIVVDRRGEDVRMYGDEGRRHSMAV